MVWNNSEYTLRIETKRYSTQNAVRCKGFNWFAPPTHSDEERITVLSAVRLIGADRPARALKDRRRPHHRFHLSTVAEEHRRKPEGRKRELNLMHHRISADNCWQPNHCCRSYVRKHCNTTDKEERTLTVTRYSKRDHAVSFGENERIPT